MGHPFRGFAGPGGKGGVAEDRMPGRMLAPETALCFNCTTRTWLQYNVGVFPSVQSRVGRGRRFSVIAVVSSAGSLKALATLLAGLPADFPAPIVLAQHLGMEFPTLLVNLLQRHTPLHVCWAKDGQLLTPGTVYVGPPGHHTLVSGPMIVTIPDMQRRGAGRPSGDLLFTSAAVSYGSEAVGVVLSGYLNDGARGGRIIRRLGGAVIVQDPASAAVPDMPLASIAAGPVDFVLPAPVIPAALTTLAMQAGAAELFCGPVPPVEIPRAETPLVV